MGLSPHHNTGLSPHISSGGIRGPTSPQDYHVNHPEYWSSLQIFQLQTENWNTNTSTSIKLNRTHFNSNNLKLIRRNRYKVAQCLQRNQVIKEFEEIMWTGEDTQFYIITLKWLNFLKIFEIEIFLIATLTVEHIRRRRGRFGWLAHIFKGHSSRKLYRVWDRYSVTIPWVAHCLQT